MKVLVTEGGRGQAPGAVSAVRALGLAGHEVHVTVSGRFSSAGWSRHCDHRIMVPPAEHAEYADVVRRLLAVEPYDVVLPTSDVALLQLGWPGAEFIDKGKLHARAELAGVASPKHWSFEDGADLLERAHELVFPVAVKQVTSASHRAPRVFRADDAAQLQVLRDSPAPVAVEEWLSGEQSCVAGVVWEGRLRAVVHQRYVRTWPRDCGDSCYAVTSDGDRELEARLVELLEGYDGIFQCELIDGRLHDLNPRVYGSLSLAVRAGVDLPDIVCRLTGGEGVGARGPVRARTGVAVRWVEGELRHLVEAVRTGEMTRGAAARALRPRRGTAHADVSLLDPAPSLARLVFAVHGREEGHA